MLGRQGCLGALFLNLPIGLVYKRMQKVQRSEKCVHRNWGGFWVCKATVSKTPLFGLGSCCFIRHGLVLKTFEQAWCNNESHEF